MKKNVGTSYFKDLSRKDYVVQASRIIKKEGVEGYQHPAYCGRTGMFFCQYVPVFSESG